MHVMKLDNTDVTLLRSKPRLHTRPPCIPPTNDTKNILCCMLQVHYVTKRSLTTVFC